MRIVLVAFCILASHLTAVNTYDLQIAMQPKDGDREKTYIPSLNPEELKGELKAILAGEYSEPNVMIDVDPSGNVTLFNMPASTRLRESICAYIRNYPKVVSVKVVESKGYRPMDPVSYVAFPQTLLFYPLLANPFEVETSWSAFLHNTQPELGKDPSFLTNFSIGAYIPFVRWFSPVNSNIAGQLDFEAKSQTILQILPYTRLRETSYRFGFNGSIATKVLSYRLSFSHYCAHFGDQFAVNLYEQGQYVSDGVVNIWPLELTISAQSTDFFRLYFGGAVGTFRQESTYFLYGAEFYFCQFTYLISRTFYQPFVAIDFQNWERFNYDPSITLKGGLSIGRLPFADRQIRITLLYHNGLGFGPYLFRRQEYVTTGFEYGF